MCRVSPSLYNASVLDGSILAKFSNICSALLNSFESVRSSASLSLEFHPSYESKGMSL